MTNLKERIHGVCLAVFWPPNTDRFETTDKFLVELIDIFARNDSDPTTRKEWNQLEREVLVLLDIWPSRYLKINMNAFRRDLNMVHRVWKMSR